MRQVVSNTGPILHLHESKLLDLLEQTGALYIPKAVDVEIGRLDRDWPAHKPAWIVVETVSPLHATQALRWQQVGLLHAGEAEAIALARKLNADWFLTDDGAARVFATSLGIEVHGSLGIVLWSAAVGHLGKEVAESALERLAQSSLWISARVLAEAHEALAQLFP